MKVILAGAFGNLGAEILKALCNAGHEVVAAVAPPFFSGTFVFVGLMVAGLGLMNAGLCVMSAKVKKPVLSVLFVISFICSLGMGYLSSRDFDGAMMNWIAEGVNTVGQGALLIGAILLHKSGFEKLRLHGGEEV